jgi:hypothetical protein
MKETFDGVCVCVSVFAHVASVAGLLVAGGYSKHHAAVVGERAHEDLCGEEDGGEAKAVSKAQKKKKAATWTVIAEVHDTTPTVFDFTTPSVFSANHPVTVQLKEMLAKNDAIHTSKLDVLGKEMKGNIKLSGAMARMSCDLDGFVLKFGDKTFEFDNAGAMPWLSCVRSGFWRWGANQLPLPGVGSLMFGVATDDFWLQLVPAHAIHKEGVSLADCKRFLETPVASNVTEISCMIRVDQGVCVYVPFGWIAIPTYIDQNKLVSRRSSSKKADLAELFQTIVSLPLFEVELAKGIPRTTWEAVAAYNTAYLVKKAGDRMWAPRVDLFKTFVSKV